MLGVAIPVNCIESKWIPTRDSGLINNRIHLLEKDDYPGYDRFREALAGLEIEKHLDHRTWVSGIFDPAGLDVNAVNSRLWPSGNG